jgi:hypothetical protein
LRVGLIVGLLEADFGRIYWVSTLSRVNFLSQKIADTLLSLDASTADL